MKILILLCLVLSLMLFAPGFGNEAEQAEELDESLLQAAANGDIAQVKSLLSKGADIIVTSRGRQTALHNAAYGGHTDVVKLLIARGADVNAQDRLQTT
ncbi:MAG: ankyrin repeat domain-containing protein, partial [Phycisphaerales bacterium]